METEAPSFRRCRGTGGIRLNPSSAWSVVRGGRGRALGKYSLQRENNYSQRAVRGQVMQGEVGSLWSFLWMLGGDLYPKGLLQPNQELRPQLSAGVGITLGE